MKKIMICCMAMFVLNLNCSGVSANSFGFDTDVLIPQNNRVSISLVYDFTDFAMFGGSVDIIYDSTAIEFAQFEPGLLPPDVEMSSPVGVLTEPGLISHIGVIATSFFSGINSQGTVGTFYFNILGSSDAGSTPCGMVLCIVSNAINPFISLTGMDETSDILANSITGARIELPVPVPGALWLMLSGLGLLVRTCRQTS